MITYNPIGAIDEGKVLKRWFHYIFQDVRQVALTPWSTAKRPASLPFWQTCTDYPFDDPEGRRMFNQYGSILYDRRFRKARRRRQGRGTGGGAGAVVRP